MLDTKMIQILDAARDDVEQAVRCLPAEVEIAGLFFYGDDFETLYPFLYTFDLARYDYLALTIMLEALERNARHILAFRYGPTAPAIRFYTAGHCLIRTDDSEALPLLTRFWPRRVSSDPQCHIVELTEIS